MSALFQPLHVFLKLSEKFGKEFIQAGRIPVNQQVNDFSKLDEYIKNCQRRFTGIIKYSRKVEAMWLER